MTPEKTALPAFNTLGIAPNLLAELERKGYMTPTPIQHQVIPSALEGKDVVGIAQTGTGKTLAFGIPMLQRLGIHKGQGLVLVPTRELALQVDEVFQKLAVISGSRRQYSLVEPLCTSRLSLSVGMHMWLLLLQDDWSIICNKKLTNLIR
jgi:superfamily II DNA/RNA helicase